MSSRIRRLIKGSHEQPNDYYYGEILRATSEKANAMKILRKADNDRSFRRCTDCQESYPSGDFHSRIDHRTLPPGTTRRAYDNYLEDLEKKIDAGTYVPRDIAKVSPLLKVAKALLFDIEAATPVEAVTGSETWRDRWIESVKFIADKDGLKKASLDLGLKIKQDWLHPPFNLKEWASRVEDAEVTEDIYQQLLLLDSHIVYLDSEGTNDIDAKARPLRKMARPELALKWGYKPGNFYTDRKSGITGRALHVQDGRLVLEIVHPNKTKGKMRRYTMTQAKQWLDEVDAKRAKEFALEQAASSEGKANGVSLESLRKKLKATRILMGDFREDRYPAFPPEVNDEDNGDTPPLEACKSLISDIIEAMSRVTDIEEGSENNAIWWKLNGIRESLNACASHEGIQRCLLEAETLLGDVSMDRRWGAHVRAAKNESELIPLIIDFDSSIPYMTLGTSVMNPRASKGSSQRRLLEKKQAKALRKASPSPGPEESPMDLEDMAASPEEEGDMDVDELMQKYKLQSNASRIVQQTWKEGDNEKSPSLPTMLGANVVQREANLVVAQSLLLDICKALPSGATRPTMDREALIQRIRGASSTRIMVSLAENLGRSIDPEYFRHENSAWQRECRNVRSSARLLDLILRLDHAIRFDDSCLQDDEEIPESSPPSGRVKRKYQRGSKRPTRPDLARKWGYEPGAMYYDRKLKQRGRCLYVQAGNLVVSFGDKQRRYNMESARRQLRRQGGGAEETFEEDAPNIRRGGKKGVPRPVDGTHYRYSEEATYVASIRAWSLEWIEYIPTGCVIKVFCRVELDSPPPGDYAVWMLLRTGEGRGARSVAYLLDLQSHKVGWVDLSMVTFCGPRCSPLEIDLMQDWQSKLRRRPFAPSKIRPVVPRGSRQSRSLKRSRRNADTSDRPLRRSRRQERMAEGNGAPLKYKLIIANLRARVADLESHNLELVDHNHMLLGRLGKFESYQDNRKEKPSKSLQEVEQGEETPYLPKRGGGELQIVERAPDDPVQRIVAGHEIDCLATIISFLDIKERSKVSRVCSLWNTPLINQFTTTMDFVKIRDVTDKIVCSIACKHTEV
mmetsp:Transcript_15256/g.24132  ORF Transcript_15256/g.24132 Transcript_15256/m.24132 type:complete len:1077 (+) Transcript_15256:78-3308(+)